MCGPAGAGKSTYARRLERDGMIRLSFDTELWRRGVVEVPPPQETNLQVEADLRARLVELAGEGADVVCDFSFTTLAMREDYRRLLEPTGVVPETVYLATDWPTVLDRLRARRGGHGDDLVIDEALARRQYDAFEVPTADEGPLTRVG